jgi:hydantoinase/carbamoylase family amidase
MAEEPPIDAARVIADLRELDRRTGGPEGARRLCWGPGWREARDFLSERLAELGLGAEPDEAGNLWAYLEGEPAPALALGSHLDSVPGGGWLDGALGVMAGLGVLRAWSEAGAPPPRTLALVDWADEEGARFGRSLFGSSAAAGTLEPVELAAARDAEGRSAPDLLAENGVELELAPRARSRLERLGAYLELHIEQGPVLESEGLAAAAVSGCVGIERWRFRLEGQASHAGTTPMEARRDAGLAAAEAALRIERIGREVDGVATTGQLSLSPGIPTAVAGRAELVADLRHGDPVALAEMLQRCRQAVSEVAAERGCRADAELVWRIEPTRFDPGLVAAAQAACAAVAGSERTLTSGALHDAAAVAAVLPAAMVFCPSRGGISHAKEEDTAERDLVAGVEAFGRLATRALSG